MFEAAIFVAVLGASDYTYVEATRSQQLPWTHRALRRNYPRQEPRAVILQAQNLLGRSAKGIPTTTIGSTFYRLLCANSMTLTADR